MLSRSVSAPGRPGAGAEKASQLSNERFRVLILASDPFSASIRLSPFLDCLRFQGVIEGYCIVDRDLASHGPDRFPAYSHVIAQRNISTNQFRWLKAAGVPFVYDIDDLLTELPARADRNDAPTRQRIGWCLENASAVTTSGGRLAGLLQASSGVPFADRHFDLPNGLWPPSIDPSRLDQPAKTLLWVSSDIPLITLESPHLAQRIADTAAELELAPLLVGRFPPEIVSRFRNPRHIERLDYVDYRRLLTVIEQPVAIAPLPIAAPRHQDFIDAKSDIKVVDFQGHGIPAVYSAAAPYAESDLAPLATIPNDPDLWAETLLRGARRPELLIDRAAVDRVHGKRAYSVLAATLSRALDRSGGSVRHPRAAVNAITRRFEQRLRGAWRSVRPRR